MLISRFVPGAQAPKQQQPPPTQVQSPLPPPPPSHQRKRPRTIEQAQPSSGDVPTKTPPRLYDPGTYSCRPKYGVLLLDLPGMAAFIHARWQASPILRVCMGMGKR